MYAEIGDSAVFAQPESPGVNGGIIVGEGSPNWLGGGSIPGLTKAL